MIARPAGWVLAILLAVTGLAGISRSGAAAGTTVYLQTVDILSGAPITTACYVILNASEEGCDANRDGLIRYLGVASGDFIVTQTQRAPGYLPVGDFPITIGATGAVEYFTIALMRSDGVVQRTADVSVSPIDSVNFNRIAGSCFVFYGGSIEGCDENGDGQVDYRGIAVGTYLLHQTRPIPGYQAMDDVWLAVTGDALWYVRLESAAPGPAGGVTNIAIVTRDPVTGDLLTGACYIVQNASIEGCDENGDGQVDYRGIATGTFTVTQTRAPAGYPPIPDFRITITGQAGQVVLVRQGALPTGQVDISIVAVNNKTGERIRSTSTCFVLRGGSEEGCDLNADGQVDFLGVATGVYSLVVTGNPPGYFAVNGPLSIDANRSGVYEVQFIPVGS